MLRGANENHWHGPMTLRDGEALRLALHVNHVRNWVAIGGRLLVTTERIAFVPNNFNSYGRDQFVGLDPQRRFWRMDRHSVGEVQRVAPRVRPWTLFSGEWRAGLWVQLKNDPGQRFVLWGSAHTAAERVKAALNEEPPPQ